MEEKLKTLIKKMRLPSIALVSGLVGLIILNQPKNIEKRNWAKTWAEISSYDNFVKTYIHRDGSHSYFTKIKYCDKGEGFKIVVDRDNDWLPEYALTITGCGDGWMDRFENKEGFSLPRDREYFKTH